MKRSLIVILVITISLSVFGITKQVDAKDSETWNPTMAKKLMSLNWGSVGNQAKEPIVIYLIRFRELDSKVVNSYDIELSVDDQKDVEDWQIITDDSILKLMQRDTMYFALKGWQTEETHQNYYDAKLMTVGEQAVSVKLEEDLISTGERDFEKKESYFELAFKPQKISEARQEILTSLQLQTSGKEGNVVDTKVTNWIGKEIKEPLVILAYQEESNEEEETKYFGLYVTAKAAMPEQLAVEGSFVPMGDISGLNNLFTNSEPKVASRNELTFYLDKDGAELEFEGVTNDNNKLYANIVDKDSELRYRVGMDYTIFNGLAASGRVSDWTTEEAKLGIYLGAMDRVYLKDNIEAAIYYWPLGYNPDRGKFIETRAEVGVEWQKQEWKLWYQGLYLKSKYSNRLGADYRVTPNWAVRTRWSRKQDREQKVSVGLKFMF